MKFEFQEATSEAADDTMAVGWAWESFQFQLFRVEAMSKDIQCIARIIIEVLAMDIE